MDPETSAEYRTLTTHNEDLILAMSNNICQLSDLFVSGHLITPNQSSELRSKHYANTKRAADLVYLIQLKVLERAANYHTFVNVLKHKNECLYEDILKKLQKTYSRLAGEGNP